MRLLALFELVKLVAVCLLVFAALLAYYQWVARMIEGAKFFSSNVIVLAPPRGPVAAMVRGIK